MRHIYLALALVIVVLLLAGCTFKIRPDGSYIIDPDPVRYGPGYEGCLGGELPCGDFTIKPTWL